MELKAIKIELFKQDEEPDFDIDDLEAQIQLNPNDSKLTVTPLNKKQSLPSSKMSLISNPTKSNASSILYSPEKIILNELKRKHTGFQSISPFSPIRNKSSLKRPIFSATKNNNSKNLLKQEATFGRTSYSPTLSPQKKNTLWYSWLTPMNSTLRQKTSQEVPKITAQSYCVLQTQTNEILAFQNMDTQRQIASLTKIMTAYTTLNICSTFGIKIRQHYVCINKQAAWMNGTSAGLKTDQQILIIDLLYALLLPSGNDAGVALAQYFGKFLSFKFAQQGTSHERVKNSLERFRDFKDFYDTQYEKDSLKLFVFEMNKNAHKIGLKNTHFNNPTGLSDKNNYSTARDMALFTSHCLNNHTLRMIFKKKFHTCDVINSKMSSSRQVMWKNTNRHLFQFRECIGIKTGITPNAGPCLSSAYKVMGKQIVVVVLQCQSLQSRYKDAQLLFKWCRKKIRAL